MVSKYKMGVNTEQNLKDAVISVGGGMGAEISKCWENVIYVEDIQ